MSVCGVFLHGPTFSMYLLRAARLYERCYLNKVELTRLHYPELLVASETERMRARHVAFT